MNFFSSLCGPLCLVVCLILATPVAASDWKDSLEKAPAGSVIRVPAGNYEGTIVLRKPITLKGEKGSRINGLGKGHVIHVKANNVVLEGLVISGSGTDLSKDHAAVFIEGTNIVVHANTIEDALHGVYVKKGYGCRITENLIKGKTELEVPVTEVTEAGIIPDGAETCRIPLQDNQRGNGIHLWNSSHNIILNNQITETRDGIYFSFAHHTQTRGNTIRNVRYGLHYMYSDHNVFEHNTFSENAAGAAIMYSEKLFVRKNVFTGNRGHRAYGLLMQSVDDTMILENVISENTVGMYLENSNRNILRGNEVARNYLGFRLNSSSSENAFTGNLIAANTHPVEIAGNTGNNRWALEGVGNFWHGAPSIDFDQDGIGDLPHREVDAFGPYRRNAPWIALLSESPAANFIRWFHRHAQVPGMPEIVDPAPLTPSFQANALVYKKETRDDHR